MSMLYKQMNRVGLKRLCAMISVLQTSPTVAACEKYANTKAEELKMELAYLLSHRAISWDLYVKLLDENELFTVETIEFIDSLRPGHGDHATNIQQS